MIFQEQLRDHACPAQSNTNAEVHRTWAPLTWCLSLAKRLTCALEYSIASKAQHCITLAGYAHHVFECPSTHGPSTKPQARSNHTRQTNDPSTISPLRTSCDSDSEQPAPRDPTALTLESTDPGGCVVPNETNTTKPKARSTHTRQPQHRCPAVATQRFLGS